MTSGLDDSGMRLLRWSLTAVIAAALIVVVIRVSACLGDDLCTFAPGALQSAVMAFVGGPMLVLAVWLVPALLRLRSMPRCAGPAALGGAAAALLVLLAASSATAGGLVAAADQLPVKERAKLRQAIDAYRATHPQAFDAVVARGFGPPEITLGLAVRLVRPAGRIVISEPPTGDRWDSELLVALGLRRLPVGPVSVFRRTTEP